MKLKKFFKKKYLFSDYIFSNMKFNSSSFEILTDDYRATYVYHFAYLYM